MSTQLNPYLSFRGNAREAMGFYQSVFGGELADQHRGAGTSAQLTALTSSAHRLHTVCIWPAWVGRVRFAGVKRTGP
jgi:predicted 3-demethylubiquinone-9 3-methyltransferase (glyoxalase superfamily)